MTQNEIEYLKYKILKGWSVATSTTHPSITEGFFSAVKLIVYLETKLKEKENGNERKRFRKIKQLFKICR